AHELFRENKFYNALSLADELVTTGTTWCGDFTDIDRDFSDPDGSAIDHIYIRSPWLDTMTYQVIRETYNGVYPSDHFPVITEVMPIE
ncbi:MAG: hypothetical protein PUD59_02040, partial [bacterium]|nr:hypothetical protein [bacterium]